MLYAKKANKAIRIEDREQETYVAQGFDVVEYDKSGNETLIKAGYGKTVPYAKYAELEADLAALKAEQKPAPKAATKKAE